VTCVLLTNAAVRGRPFTFTTAPLTKYKPFTMSAKGSPPANTLGGIRDVIAGGGRKTLKGMLVELPPPGAGFITETGMLSAVATSGAKI
jgi:hypothetical protein